MGSNDRFGQRMLKSRTQAKAVLVDLDRLYGPQRPSTTVDGLILTGWARGALSEWHRRSDGRWVGIVSYLVADTEGRTVKFSDQLVPAEAIRPE